MNIAFILSMPGVASWNGRWSGEGNLYAVVRGISPKKAQEILARPYYSYDFGDGWRASVEAKQVDGVQSRRLRKMSKGFCGYDWMVDSIIHDGGIFGPTQPKPAF